MTTEQFEKKQKILSDLGLCGVRIMKLEEAIRAFKEQPRDFALRDTGDLNSPIVNIPQEEALPFFERELELQKNVFAKGAQEYEAIV